MQQKPLIEGIFSIQKFNAKGGWTYIMLPASIKKDKKQLRVKGFIDDYKINRYLLNKLGPDELFLPLKTALRKHIRKGEGDKVKVVLYEDYSLLEIPEDLIICLKDEPKAHEFFMQLTEGYQTEYINWIYSAKHEETRSKRMAAVIERLLMRKTLSKP